MPRGIYKRTKYHRKRMSEGAKNRKITPLFRKARADNAKINLNYGMKGKHHSKETKKTLSILGKGRKSHRRGKTLEREYGKKKAKRIRKKLSTAQFGEKSHAWRGGVSFEPYSVDWTETLKRSIRERDHYICQLCSKYGNCVHHVDYDKKNCDPKNLITLCNGCNVRVNFNRKYWKEYFRFVN